MTEAKVYATGSGWIVASSGTGLVCRVFGGHDGAQISRCYVVPLEIWASQLQGETPMHWADVPIEVIDYAFQALEDYIQTERKENTRCTE